MRCLCLDLCVTNVGFWQSVRQREETESPRRPRRDPVSQRKELHREELCRELPLSVWLSGTSLMAQWVKNPPQYRRHRRRRFIPWVRKIPWRKKWQPTPVFLPEKFHGQRSLVDCSSKGHKDSDRTERLNAHTYVIEYWSAHMCEETPQGQGEKNSKRLQLTVIGTNRVRNDSYFWQPDWRSS